MLITEKSAAAISNASNFSYYLFGKKDGRKFGTTTVAVVVAQKRDLGEHSKRKEESIFPLRLPTTTLAQSAVVTVFGLGFIDAGYSGDWSRIGAISKETEETLKIAAFFVIPLCLVFLIFSFSRRREA